MSQIEQDFRRYLNSNPEVEHCYALGLVNRRGMARHLIKNNIAKSSQLEAVIAMLRRFKFKSPIVRNPVRDIRTSIKDGIMVLNFEKEGGLLNELYKLSDKVPAADTLKIVVGSSSIKLFLDSYNEKKITHLIKNYKLKKKLKNLSEISLLFPKDAIKQKGVLSGIIRDLSVNDIAIVELITNSPELLIYLNEKNSLKAFELMRSY